VALQVRHRHRKSCSWWASALLRKGSRWVRSAQLLLIQARRGPTRSTSRERARSYVVVDSSRQKARPCACMSTASSAVSTPASMWPRHKKSRTVLAHDVLGLIICWMVSMPECGCDRNMACMLANTHGIISEYMNCNT